MAVAAVNSMVRRHVSDQEQQVLTMGGGHYTQRFSDIQIHMVRHLCMPGKKDEYGNTYSSSAPLCEPILSISPASALLGFRPYTTYMFW